MDLERFRRELPGHYDYLVHPTEITGEIDPLQIKELNANQYTAHLIGFARSLLSVREYYLQLNGCEDTLYDREQKIIQIPEKNLSYLTSRLTPLKGKIGCCYIDQRDPHHLIIISRMIKPFLADRAVIIVHHINQFKVRQICVGWFKKEKAVSPLFLLPTPVSGYPTWNDGLQILGYCPSGE